MNFDQVLALGITILFCGLIYGTYTHNEPGRKCTNAELHQIIEQVEKHKKKNAGVYDHEYGEKLIREVCQ